MVGAGAEAEAEVEKDQEVSPAKENAAVSAAGVNHGIEEDQRKGKLQKKDDQDRDLENEVALETKLEYTEKENVEVEVKNVKDHVLEDDLHHLHLLNFLFPKKDDLL
ncbi:hypothetical protein QE152_g22422 [Popillia japonica]|uniref:Uncharacterized protein n=1 Tax=Popillia japonica TaxID=7064 RepID=A0AAW1KK25_POPJA